jgi:hypothetical protein
MTDILAFKLPGKNFPAFFSAVFLRSTQRLASGGTAAA